jgi:hypothetical protein
MSENSDKWLISVCGLNCAKCDIHEAGHGDKKLRDEIIEWFRKERNETVKPEQVRCEGCTGPLIRHWSPDCKMMLCKKETASTLLSMRRLSMHKRERIQLRRHISP